MKPFTTQQFKKIALSIFTSYALFSMGNVNAGLLSISDKPLDVIEGVPANIILTMDDSGSMRLGYTPSGIINTWNTLRSRANEFNASFYNPAFNYTPGVDKYGISLGDSTFTNAWNNGYNQGGSTRNLSTSFRVYWGTNQGWSGPRFPNTLADSNSGNIAAYYYYFDSTKTTGAVACDINNTTHVTANDDCYSRKTVSTTSGPGNTDELQNFANWYSYYRLRHLTAKTAATRSFSSLSDQIRISWSGLTTTPTTPGNTLPLAGSHRTNFFNWLTNVPTSGNTPLRRAIGRAGTKYSQSGSNSPYARDPGTSGTPEYSCRQNFYFAFTDGEWNSSNANPTAGNYDNIGRTFPNGPKYGAKTYAVTSTMAANTTPPIYSGGNGNMLADIALRYWATDLRTSLINDVPVYEPDITTDIDGDGDVDANDKFWNPVNDPAQWQHMVTFFIGMGVNGSLNFDGTTTSGTTYDQLMQGTTAWSGNRVDDMWHAAINGRGQYFSATKPQELVDAFKSVLDNIDQRTASNSAIATTSSNLLNGAVLFQASYEPDSWSGEIQALDAVLVPGTATTRATLSYTTKWSGKAILAAQGSSREILTYNPTSNVGVPFRWSDLDTSQQLALDPTGTDPTTGTTRLNYIRGDTSNESRFGGSFRNRNTSLYGDIVHSDPQFVDVPGPPVTFYPDSLESIPYSTFVTNQSSRTKTLLFGSNDGMLHVLNAETGQEILGYVPSPVYRNLIKLTEPAYNHKFFVDQTVRIEDVFFDNAWHTIAVGGLGNGGQGIFALDITTPGTLSEATAGTSVLWEFTDQDDADLGYSYTRPQLFKMNNGQWMAGFSNGHNSDEDDTANGGNQSATGNGIMYFIDLATGGKGRTTPSIVPGTLIKLDTGVGSVNDPTGAGRSNRLTDFLPIDIDKNFTIDILYAGDLFGNLWKFDVSSTLTSEWKVVGDGAGPKPLFIAKDSSGKAQPITLPPEAIKQRVEDGRLIYFGTGKYLESGDRTDTSIQSIYGIWDRGEVDTATLPLPTITNTIDRSHLLAQWVDFEGTVKDTDGITDIEYRTSTKNASTKKFGRYEIDWFTGTGLPTSGSGYLGWYIDMGVTGSLSSSTITSPDGEKIDNHLFLDSSGFDAVLEFATLVPNDNPCDKGGNTWLYRLDALTGNLLGGFQFIDQSTVQATNSAGDVINVSAAKFPKRASFTKTYDTKAGQCTEINIVNSSDGSIGVASTRCSNVGLGRRSWRQIIIE